MSWGACAFWAAGFGFDSCFTVCGQTYPRKVDARILNCLSSMAQSVYRMANDIRLLQHDRQLKVIGNSLEKKLRADLEKLLRDDPDRTVLSVAVDCGFNNTANYNRIFRKVTGTTPSAYRAEAERDAARPDAE